MRHFVRQSLKGCRCGSYSQFYISAISHDLLNIISKELNVNGKVCEIIDKYFEYTNKLRKIENGFDSLFKDYRDINQEKKTNYNNKKLVN